MGKIGKNWLQQVRLQSMIIRLLLKQDEQDKRQNRKNIEIILQACSLCLCFEISILRNVHSIICFVDFFLVYRVCSDSPCHRSLLAGSLTVLALLWVIYKLNFQPGIILLSIFMSEVSEYKKYFCQIIWTSSKTYIYLEALLFYFVKITSFSFHLDWCYDIEKLFYIRNTFMSFFLTCTM